MIFWLFLIFFVVVCVSSYKFYFGSGIKNTLYNDIMVELSQYNNNRVEKYLALNDVKNTIKNKKIKSVSDFFEKENLNEKAFYTATQKEIMLQSGQLLNKKALAKSDLDLYNAYINQEDIFL